MVKGDTERKPLNSRTKKFPNGVYEFYKEFNSPEEAYDEWKRIKRKYVNPPLLRISPTGWNKPDGAVKVIMWMKLDRKRPTTYEERRMGRRRGI
jgi:hypothetical protein